MDEYYKILNIDSNFTIENVKKSYRKLSIKYHPDKNNDNKEYFNKINNAYSIITDYLENNNTNTNTNNNNNTNTNTNNNNNNNNNTNTNDFINNKNNNDLILPITNYENNYYNEKNKYNEDIIKDLNITFEESYNGSIKPININRQIFINNTIKRENETIYITIPKGIDNEELIIIQNKGNYCNGNYSNLKIIIILIKHNDFIRNGLDIFYNTSINFKESLVGFEFILKHLNNKNYKIQNKKNTIIHNNTKIVLNNLGFIRDIFVGNLYITFTINYPKFIDNETIEKLNEIL